jgi:DNA-binding transcriptional LysR family regulator
MELSSIEAIKNAVQSGLGVAFVSLSAIEKELQIRVLTTVKIEQIVINRILSVIYNPNRYRSKAAEAFSKEILPLFSTFNFNPDNIKFLSKEIQPIEVITNNISQT